MTTNKPSTRKTPHPAKGKTQAELQLEIANLKLVAIAAAEATYHYRLVGRAIGRDEDTLIEWRKEDKEFSERLEEARFRFLNKQIKKSRPEFLLERLEPDVFKLRSETDITSKGNEIGAFASLTADQLRALAEAQSNATTTDNSSDPA